MRKGVNRADPIEKALRSIAKSLNETVQKKEGPCVFISHQKADTDQCVPIAEYLVNSGVDIYFDKYDKTLSQFTKEGDPNKITGRLQEGIDNSSHMICVVSQATVQSYWVPFEVGYGYRHIKLGILTLQGIADDELPDYMRTTRVIRGTQSLNEFIAELLDQPRTRLEEQRIIKGHAQESHPLDSILDWKR